MLKINVNTNPVSPEGETVIREALKAEYQRGYEAGMAVDWRNNAVQWGALTLVLGGLIGGLVWLGYKTSFGTASSQPSVTTTTEAQ